MSPRGSRRDIQQTLVSVGAIGLLIGLVILLWALADVLMMVFLGVLLALGLRALAEPVERYTPLSAMAALAAVVVALLLLIGLGGALLVPAVASQTGELVEQVQSAAEQLQSVLTQTPLGDVVPDDVLEENGGGIPGVENIVSGLTETFAEGFGVLANVLFIVFIGLFVAVDPQRYRQGLIRLVPPRGRRRAQDIVQQVVLGLRSWLAGRIVSMAAIAVIISIGLGLLGVPLALALGVLTGLLEFIPVVGPLLSAVPAVLMGFTVDPMRALYVALFYLAVQQLEGNVLTPIVQLKTASLPPVLTLTAVLAMGLLVGPLGVLVATPLAVVMIILVQELYVKDFLEGRQP